MMADTDECTLGCNQERNLHALQQSGRGGGGATQQGPYSNIRDALTGQLLDPILVQAGRATEMDFLNKWAVYS